MVIKKVTPLSHNIRSFIWKNGMSRRQFADELNKKMESYGDYVKIYTEKDILGYETRSSKPDDDRALVAMAQIMCKPLEELLTKPFEMDEFALLQNKKASVPIKKWSMGAFNKLGEEDRNLILDLIATGTYMDNERFYTVLDIGLSYHEGKRVTATLYYGSDFEKEINFEWAWTDYGKEMEEFGGLFEEEDEAYIIYRKLESELFDKLWNIGLIDDFYCFKATAEENYFEVGRETNGHFVANVWFSIPQADMLRLLKLNVKRAKKEYERLFELERVQNKDQNVISNIEEKGNE